jgi:hypothetical protein
MSEIKHPVYERLNRAVSEAARGALAAEFEGIGILFSDLHPTIRAVMERGAIPTADAKQQVDSFVRVAALADKFNLTDEERDYALVKAYEQHRERLFDDAQETARIRRADPPRPGV